jgi:hypothetical protein
LSNPLLDLIKKGRITSLKELKATYHKLIMKTHPDAVGSDKLVGKYLEFNNHYEEAKAFLNKGSLQVLPTDEVHARNHRLEFYRQLHIIESLELPYAFHPKENVERIKIAKQEALAELSTWNQSAAGLYSKADQEYVSIKREKPSGPYLKNALALNVRPIFHNTVSFHLTGQAVYAKQARQNLSAILHYLDRKGLYFLHRFISFLLEDLKNGAAVLD